MNPDPTKPISQSDQKSSDLRVWLADLTYTQQTIAADVIPNAVGGIGTYTEKELALKNPIRLFKYPEALAKALQEGPAPDVVGFSNYVWNGSLSYGFAKVIKRVLPGTVIVFGGPNYPTTKEEQKRFLRQHPAVDFYVTKEGELAFKRLIETLIEDGGDIESVKRRQIPSIHAVGADGQTYLTQTIERITDLSIIPSPYTTGRLDEFFDGKLLPIVQTNRGCPFTCTFCVEGVDYYNKVRRSGQPKVSAELHYIGRKMHELHVKGGRNDLFIADSNFGMYREDLDTARTLAETQKLFNWPEYINVATGKNQKERVLEASKIINGALRLSGSVQSLDPTVLENIKRNNIDARGLFDLGLKAEELGANTYSEIILALPGDSLNAHQSTVRDVMNAGFTNIFLFQLMLLPGTEMATEESKEEYGMVTRYRVLPRCYGHYEVLGERVVAAEIEEICIANNTLSFEDYLLARRFHLVVTIYYNDGIFASLLKLLRSLNIPVYGWMDLLTKTEMPDHLKPLFSAFLKETRNELWDKREQLEEFIQQSGVVGKFINGELGNNLLFVHKTLGITQYLDQLAAFARTTLYQYLKENNAATDEVMEFVDDALKFHCYSAGNLFKNLEQIPETRLVYDIDAFLKAEKNARIEDFRLSVPTLFRFVLDDAQRALIERYLRIYGNSPVSIGRILSKVHVKKIFRHAIADKKDAVSLVGQKGEAAYHLSGLQQ